MRAAQTLRSLRWTKLALIATLLVSAIVVTGSLIVLAKRPWLPTFDIAVIWLRTLDVGTRHSPLVGAYSRFGWDHPGPALYYALAVPLRVLGMRPSNLLIGALCIALSSSAALLWCVFRSAGLAAGLVFASALLGLSLGLSDKLISPWNPFALVLPFALFAVCTWAWSDRHARALPVAVAAGSFCIQCHVGVTAGVLAMASTSCALRLANGSFAPSERRIIAGSLALGLLLWLPPLIQQLGGEPGNLTRIAAFFFGAGAHDPAIGATLGLRLAASELVPWGAWLGFQQLGLLPIVEPASAILLAYPLGALALAAALALRFRDVTMLRLVAISAAGFVSCLCSYASIRGPALAYLIVWPRVVAMLCVAAPLMVLARRLDGAPRLNHGIVAAVLGGVLAAQALRGATAALPDAFASDVHRRFVGAAVNAVPRGASVRVIAAGPPFTVSAETLAVVLLRAGRVPQLQPWEARIPGAHRSVDGRAVLPTLALASGPAVDALATRPSGRLLVSYDPLRPRDRSRAEQLRALLTQQLTAAKRDDLIRSLDDGQAWIAFQQYPGVNGALLQRYMDLAGGDAHRRYALYAFAATTW